MITEEFLNDAKTGMNYTVSYPAKALNAVRDGKNNELPLIIYLHGAGERGTKAEHLKRHGIPKLISEGREYEAVVLCPQCPAGFVWNNVVEKLKILIDAVVLKYNIKKDRVAITGSSMGGCGTLEMCMTYPSFFSAAAPVASDGLTWRTPRLRNTPIYLYHGNVDDCVEFSCSVATYNKVKSAGGVITLTELPALGHNDGIDFSYRNTDLTDKLIAARRTDFSYVPDVCEEYF